MDLMEQIAGRDNCNKYISDHYHFKVISYFTFLLSV